MKTFLAGIVLIALVTPALEFGAIWNLRAHPAPGAQVVLEDGRFVTGLLTRTWSKEWVILAEDGSECRFKRFNSMSFKPQQSVHAGHGLPLVLRSWRSVLPAIGLFSACLLTMLLDMRSRFRRRGERVHL
jgi:hypothetical protein